MSDNTTQRDELALDIFLADNARQPEVEALMDWEAALSITAGTTYAHGIADGLIAKDYSKPRTINDRHEDSGPDDLRPLSVVLSAGKPAIMQHDGTFMDYDGCSWDTWEMTYPLTVIHEPEAEATR